MRRDVANLLHIFTVPEQLQQRERLFESSVLHRWSSVVSSWMRDADAAPMQGSALTRRSGNLSKSTEHRRDVTPFGDTTRCDSKRNVKNLDRFPACVSKESSIACDRVVDVGARGSLVSRPAPYFSERLSSYCLSTGMCYFTIEGRVIPYEFHSTV